MMTNTETPTVMTNETGTTTGTTTDRMIFGTIYSFDYANPTHALIAYYYNEFQYTEQNLQGAIDALTRDLGRAKDAIDTGLSVNMLGVVQSAGPTIDRLCALRAEKAQTLAALLNVTFPTDLVQS